MKKFLMIFSLILTFKTYALSEDRYKNFYSEKIPGEICKSMTEQLAGQMSAYANPEEYKAYYKSEKIQRIMHLSTSVIEDQIFPLCSNSDLTIRTYQDAVMDACNVGYCSKTVDSIKDSIFNSNKKTALKGCEKLCAKIKTNVERQFIGYIDGREMHKSNKNDCSKNRFHGCEKNDDQSILCSEGTYKYLGANKPKKMNDSISSAVKDRDIHGSHKKPTRAIGSSAN